MMVRQGGRRVMVLVVALDEALAAADPRRRVAERCLSVLADAGQQRARRHRRRAAAGLHGRDQRRASPTAAAVPALTGDTAAAQKQVPVRH